MTRRPLRVDVAPMLAALVLAAGCAGAPARPGSALGAEVSTASMQARSGAGAPEIAGVSTQARPAAGLASEDSVVPSSPPAVSGGRGRERGALVPVAATHEPRGPEAETSPAPRGARPDGRRERAASTSTSAIDSESPTAEPVSGARAQVVEAARRMLGTRPRLDCSGFVLAALAGAGVSVDLPPARSRSESLFLAGRLVTHPSPGDLVFFHRTHDRDRKGSRAARNRFTHVALVETVDGTALTLLHRGGKRVERIRMDLSRPSDPAANDPVRLRRRHDRPGTRYLSGELFAAFGGLLPDDVTRKLQARRGRDTPARHPASR